MALLQPHQSIVIDKLGIQINAHAKTLVEELKSGGITPENLIKKVAPEFARNVVAENSDFFRSLLLGALNQAEPSARALQAAKLDVLADLLQPDAEPVTDLDVKMQSHAHAFDAEFLVRTLLLRDVILESDHYQLTMVLNFLSGDQKWVRDVAIHLGEHNPFLDRRVSELELSARLNNCLTNPCIDAGKLPSDNERLLREKISRWDSQNRSLRCDPTLAQLTECTPQELLALHNLGKKSLKELNEYLDGLGLCLSK